MSAFAPHIAARDWDTMRCRVEQQRRAHPRAARRRGRQLPRSSRSAGSPSAIRELVRRIVDAGHELASHGFDHRRASEQQRDAFLADIRLAKAILEDIAGREVRGYRAPSFSIGPANPWAFDCIAEAGYRYSSSIYPIRHDHYGVPDAPRFAHEVRPGLLEVPVATVRMLRVELAGRWRRLFPAAALRDVALVDPPHQRASIGSRRCSIFIRGSSIPISRACRARA